MLQPDLLSLFIAPLEKSGLNYMITGSVASTFYGEPRLTHDIDLVLWLKFSQIDDFCSLFPSSDFYCPPADIIGIELGRKVFSHFNIIHLQSGFKADCYPFTGNPLQTWGLNNRKKVQLNPDLTVQVAPVEYVIIRKLQFYKEGKSQKHLLDIKAMLNIQNSLIDNDVLFYWIEELTLKNEWNKLQEIID